MRGNERKKAQHKQTNHVLENDLDLQDGKDLLGQVDGHLAVVLKHSLDQGDGL